MPVTPGSRLGPYEVIAPLGAGGMGEVYRARDTRLGRDVAVKVLPQHLSSNTDVRARFEREAKTVSSLNHPNICTLFDVGREGDIDYLVMELLDGETLAQRLERGALPGAEVLRLGAQIADALDRAHRAGVIHRDLKPGNVMLTKTGAKLMDFGLARATATSGPESGLTQLQTIAQPLTAEGAIVGTYQYMAPEQLEGKETDARSDLWALGCMLYEMATGRRAFDGATHASIIGAVLRDEPRPVAELAPAAPAQLDQLVRACLAKDPDARWPSARAAAIALGWAAHVPNGAPSASIQRMERQFNLTSAHVRQLSDRNPKLVGYPVHFSDNQRSSDHLVVYISGMGIDGSRLEEVARGAAERSITITLPGFADGDRWRPALGIDDHSRILRFVIRELVDECRPAKLVLVGHGTAADQFFRMVRDEGGAGVAVDGLVALSPNVTLETCIGTRHFSRIDPSNPAQTLASLKSLGADIDSLEIWLQTQHYISQSLLRLGSHTETLRRYAAEIIAPFEGSGDPFTEWYRTARGRIPRVRLVFSREETSWAEALLTRHLEGNVLGDLFTEDSLVIETCRHLELIDGEIIARHVRWALEGPGR